MAIRDAGPRVDGHFARLDTSAVLSHPKRPEPSHAPPPSVRLSSRDISSVNLSKR
jgi:hypothetical protein